MGASWSRGTSECREHRTRVAGWRVNDIFTPRHLKILMFPRVNLLQEERLCFKGTLCSVGPPGIQTLTTCWGCGNRQLTFSSGCVFLWKLLVLRVSSGGRGQAHPLASPAQGSSHTAGVSPGAPRPQMAPGMAFLTLYAVSCRMVGHCTSQGPL